jgi:hypothetical protein
VKVCAVRTSGRDWLVIQAGDCSPCPDCVQGVMKTRPVMPADFADVLAE